MKNPPVAPASTPARRPLLASLLALPLACLVPACSSTSGLLSGTHADTPATAPAIRAAAVGQQWVYQVRSLYNGRIVDEVTETVAATSPSVRITRVSRAAGPLADEVHASWGQVVQDPHWNYPVTFTTPLPAWPVVFEPGQSTTIDDRYQMLAEPNFSARWSQTMTARDWESVSVPAGTFTAERYDNRINFTNDDPAAVASERLESLWFVPQIGRWALRRSHGTAYYPGRGSDIHEDYFQWELSAWR